MNSQNNRALQVKEMMYGFRDEFTYIECSACGCLQIAEIPEDMPKYYPSDYRPWQRTSLKLPVGESPAIRRDRYAVFGPALLRKLVAMTYPNRFLQILGQAKPDRNAGVLDVGCGSGQFLYDLSVLGFRNLVGIDPYVEAIPNDRGIKILKKTISDLADSERFDFVFFNHSLEHIWNQEDTLSKAGHLLTPMGVCVVRMPVKTETIWNLYGTEWMQIDAPRHFCIHTLPSFRHLSQKVGFTITSVLFDSDERQFWGSEQYRNNIPLQAENSYLVNRKRSIFTEEQMEGFRKKAKELNRAQQGDQAAFFLASQTKSR